MPNLIYVGIIPCIIVLLNQLGKPSFKKIKKIMENSIIGRGGVSKANSIIQKNTVYFNTRPLFEAIK